MPAIALSIRGLRKSFARGLARCTRRTVAISDVDLDLYQSEIVALTGAEGSGKTTLLQCACGLLRPDSGSVIARHVVAYVPPIPIYYPFLTVRDVVALRVARTCSCRGGAVEGVIDLVQLHHARNDIVATLSPGELTRLSIAEAMSANPAVVLIDTSTSRTALDGLCDFNLLDRIAASGTAVMIGARETGEIESRVSREIRLSEGRVVHPQIAPLSVAERLH
jgi:ABC-type multidrug transport system ATPase subunit